MREALHGRVAGMAGWAVELMRGLTAIPAIDPGSGGTGELDKAVWLERELRRLPFDAVERIDAPDPRAKGGVRPNLVARVRGRSGGRTLWVMSHLDVVPPGERSRWSSDPFELQVDGDRLVGRGTEDNHQAVVASLVAARALAELSLRPLPDLALLFCADEETGSAFGARFLAERHPELFRAGDMFIVPDAGNAAGSLVEVAEKSIWWARVRTAGRQCHASTPALGVNAFRAASDLVTRLGSLYLAFPARDELFEPPISTFEPTKKEANVPNINTVPGDDVFYLDCRVLPGIALEAVEAEVNRLAREVEQAHGVRVTVEDVQREAAAPPTAPDAEVVRLVVDAARDVRGVDARPCGIGGGTVAAVFRRLGLAAVVYSQLEEVGHQPDEYCLLSSLLGDAEVFALAAARAS